MKIALIGPTNIELISSASGINKDIIVNSARLIGALIARYNHEIVIVPDRGVAVEGLAAYKKSNGPRVIAISPQNESDEQKHTVKCPDNLHHCDEVL